MKQLKSGFKRAINWNKCQPKVTIQVANPYLDYLIDLCFQGVKRLFLWFENTTDKTINTKYYLPSAEVKDHNVAIDEQNFSDHPVKNNLRSYDNIWKIVTSQGDDYTIAYYIIINLLRNL